ncbi:hypothetical protein S7711_06133 [Stachybotrys chartarum IBT 7711]|uniref:PhoD-like phosphatase metallophosphatase domain-containing protein n=1 Tax=Stachybotrys chartarum (strain CBS 109288 / IBT 7711) TaxID=1280523 RepID=A0A084B682_STACB|nr:hypothetical protein S7711_06133 [Stachybotrys chartarum IBT 7711]KFA56605.1 hypothetical protein S40293_01161 [Stachybotrys chartarum IBT 40293]
MKTIIIPAAAWAVGALAGYNGNLNYRSPSFSHDGLGIDLPKVTGRMLQKREVEYETENLTFTHGVASGDPYADSVILWTRIAPSLESDTSNVTVEGTVAYFSHETEKYIEASTSPICVDWVVSKAPDLVGCRPAAHGRAYTTSDIDYTVKVRFILSWKIDNRANQMEQIEAGGLQALTTYYYQFNVCGTDIKSPIGRTKTAPNEDDDVSSLNLAVFSCANYPLGYFNVYGNAARKDNVDYFVHVGDYIYEDKVGELGEFERAMIPPREIITLHDYRTRIGQYRTDSDLLLAHQNFPWITVWDDHEIANNNWRDGGSTVNNTEESFIAQGGVSFDQRKMNAVRAYFEWMPLRQVDLDDNLRIWRNFRLGNLLDLTMLDTRSYDRSITRVGWNDDYVLTISNDAGRSIMGSHQENWFFRQLSESQERGATWRVIGNQMIFSRMNMTAEGGREADVDAWDGYLSSKNRTLQHIYDNNINNVIMLAGDSHQNWVSDLVWLDEHEYDPVTGQGSVGVEFAVTAVTSDGMEGNIAETDELSRGLLSDNVELQWQEGYYRGYLELHVSHEKIDAQFFGSPSVATRNPYDVPLANFTVYPNENRLARPLAGGKVETGAITSGEVQHTNLTLDTASNEWLYIGFEQMFLPQPEE